MNPLVVVAMVMALALAIYVFVVGETLAAIALLGAALALAGWAVESAQCAKWRDRALSYGVVPDSQR